MKINSMPILIISLILIISSLFLGLTGLKNSDLSCNMMILDREYNLNLFGDKGLDGTERSFQNWYIIGLTQMYISSLLSLLSFMLLFGYILYITFKEERICQ